MKQKPIEPPNQATESLLKDFGIKPPETKREELRRVLESQKEKYMTIERIHGKNADRDLSR